MGMVLDEWEQEVWVKANANPTSPHSQIDFEAVLAEHTEPTGANEPEGRKIPAADYERASSMLGGLVTRYSQILDSGRLTVNYIRRSGSTDSFPGHETLPVLAVRESMQTAQAMLDAINDGLPPHIRSANNSAA